MTQYNQQQPQDNRGNNNGLYFIVGAIFIAVLALGAMFFTGTESGEESMQQIETAAGNAADEVDETTEEWGNEMEDAADDASSSFELETNDDGVSVETNTTN